MDGGTSFWKQEASWLLYYKRPFIMSSSSLCSSPSPDIQVQITRFSWPINYQSPWMTNTKDTVKINQMQSTSSFVKNLIHSLVHSAVWALKFMLAVFFSCAARRDGSRPSSSSCFTSASSSCDFYQQRSFSIQRAQTLRPIVSRVTSYWRSSVRTQIHDTNYMRLPQVNSSWPAVLTHMV